MQLYPSGAFIILNWDTGIRIITSDFGIRLDKFEVIEDDKRRPVDVMKWVWGVAGFREESLA